MAGHDLYRRERLMRDPQRGWIAGVFAGVANYLTVPVFWVRLLALLPLFTPLCPFFIIGYIVAAIRIPARRPAPEPEVRENDEFRAAARHSPAATFGQARHRIRAIDHRIRRMEAYVTSANFEIDRSLR